MNKFGFPLIGQVYFLYLNTKRKIYFLSLFSNADTADIYVYFNDEGGNFSRLLKQTRPFGKYIDLLCCN